MSILWHNRAIGVGCENCLAIWGLRHKCSVYSRGDVKIFRITEHFKPPSLPTHPPPPHNGVPWMMEKLIQLDERVQKTWGQSKGSINLDKEKWWSIRSEEETKGGEQLYQRTKGGWVNQIYEEQIYIKDSVFLETFVCWCKILKWFNDISKEWRGVQSEWQQTKQSFRLKSVEWGRSIPLYQSLTPTKVYLSWI